MRPLDAVGIGSMVVDRVHRAPRILGGDEKGILREVSGGEPVRIAVGGVVLNHLGWAAALGLKTGIFGRQADDEGGRFLRAAMDRFGIERDLVLDGSASSVAEIFVDDAGSRAIYMAPGATAETTAEQIRRDHADFIRRARRLTTEVSQLPLAAAREALAVACEAGIPTVVDLDVPPSDALVGLGSEAELFEVLGAASLLKPSKTAARELVPEAAADATALARAVRSRFGNEAVVVTDGEAGCAIAAEGFEGFVRAESVRALDTTGAGDAFLGGLLVGLHHGLAWEDAGRLANACGAACVEKLGAFPDAAAAAQARVLELYGGPPLRLASPPQDRGPVAAAGGGGGEEALAAFAVAVEEVTALRDRLSPSAFDAAIALIRRAEAEGGRVHVTGIGKPEHVAHYATALLASTGTPATFLHATEAVHGSAGQVVPGDVVIAISNSGETAELRAGVEAVRRMQARVLAVTGNPESWLGREADVVLEAGVAREGGALGLAPRASVAAEVLVLAALAAALEKERGFTKADYNLRHPGGDLGERSRS
ncbi:MAG: PfkB family carbohydrate kinase [Myxococcales bacterium]|nr:PfkB family carbohydrate kinase [Myxococcales bacterium]